METLTINQMSMIESGTWQQAVGCIGGVIGLVGSVALLTTLTAGAGVAAVALGCLSFEVDGVATSISCGKWAATLN